MKLCFTGLERQIEIVSGKATTLEIHERTLFERICRSLVSLKGEEAVEPYCVVGDSGKLASPRNCLFVVDSPLSLPWTDKVFAGALSQKVMALSRGNRSISRT